MGVAALGLAWLAAVEARRVWSSTSGFGCALEAAIGGVLAILFLVAGAWLLLSGAPSPPPQLPAPWERWTTRAQRRRRRTRRMKGGVAAAMISVGIIVMGEASRLAFEHQPPMATLALVAAGAALVAIGSTLVLRQSL